MNRNKIEYFIGPNQLSPPHILGTFTSFYCTKQRKTNQYQKNIITSYLFSFYLPFPPLASEKIKRIRRCMNARSGKRFLFDPSDISLIKSQLQISKLTVSYYVDYILPKQLSASTSCDAHLSGLDIYLKSIGRSFRCDPFLISARRVHFKRW